jgi:uncharacterized membrane protein
MSKDTFSTEEHQRILDAIHDAEKDTSGEIRLFVEKHCKDEVLDRAAFIFGELNMHKTDLRNGVLFYIATASHRFAVLGDAGINSKVPADFWDHIKDTMKKHFAAGDLVTGLSEGIRMGGKALKEYFPYKSGDTNELSNEIAFGKD